MLVPLLAPLPAGAAVVRLGLEEGSPADLYVTGLPGEANAVAIGQSADGRLVVRDEGAPLVAGDNCTGHGSEVTCGPVPAATPIQIGVTTGDGHDRISVIGPIRYRYCSLSGGSGADVIVGGPRDDDIDGGPGTDVLDGRDGDDDISGGTDADSLRGGPGVDTVTYGGHERAVSVSLDDVADDGAAGEGDDAASDFENIVGGRGPDRLVGTDGPNELEGGPSANDLFGGGGDDELDATESSGGRLVGGPGRDRIRAVVDSVVDVRDGERDRVDCSPWLNPMPRADRNDRLTTCSPFAGVRGTRAAVRADGRVSLRFTCDAAGRPCRVRVRLSRGSTILASGVVTVAPGRHRALLALGETGRRILERRGRVRADARYSTFVTAPARSSAYMDTRPLVLERS